MDTTYVAKPADVTRKWYVVDAEGQPLGRLATRIAHVLRGKHKPIFSPSLDTGDFVIVINAGKVALTGNKLQQKLYRRHSRYPGGMKTMTYEHLLQRRPELAIEKAVKGMLPKNRLGRQQFRKLKVYGAGEHPHAAQQPETLAL